MFLYKSNETNWFSKPIYSTWKYYFTNDVLNSTKFRNLRITCDAIVRSIITKQKKIILPKTYNEISM